MIPDDYLNISEDQLRERISGIKKKMGRRLVILGHHYQRDEVIDFADYRGDSLGLSQKAAEQKQAEFIVFCGVHFMAETAAILCPNMTVLLPDAHAGCPMADMITAQQLRQKKKELPKASVVCYVNSTAAVKAESDVCCTSANAAKVVESLDAGEILFVPDQYLGHYVSTQTSKKVILWTGYCPAHVKFRPQHITERRREHPQAKVVVHPECRSDVIALADEVLSTGGMCRYAGRDDVREMIVGTEIGMIHGLKKENPGKKFIPLLDDAICPDMKLITLGKMLWSLEEMAPEVKVPEEIRIRAEVAVDRMLDVGRG